ncbi:MAG: hypothetical protein PHR77_17385 [Kiritimatiellae bacterium]|nr:hypothetical protein [Kiritimatiellia bacterium]MDD5520318.1 hypothetical protein [Kiritimatiellia bacterium]
MGDRKAGTKMRWLTSAVKTHNFAWPKKEQKISYGKHLFVINPETEKFGASISLECPPNTNYEQCLTITNRFLSVLSWIHRGGIEITFSVGSGGDTPTQVGKSQVSFVTNHISTDYLPETPNEKTRLAIALYREAQATEMIPFKFLGFFKILNIVHDKSEKQINWINNALSNIKDIKATKRLKELQKANEDIGKYLYASGRCAVAHAFSGMVVDPDLAEDMMRLHKDTPLIRSLVEYFIETELSLKSFETFRREHLYELDGFANLLDPVTVKRLKDALPVIQNLTGLFPKMTVTLRGHTFPEFSGLSIISIKQDASILCLALESEDKLCLLALQLDFKEWRLIFDSTQCIRISDDKTSIAPLKYAIAQARFIKNQLMNGQVEVYSYPQHILLGSSDPCIPTNIDVRQSINSLDKTIIAIDKEIAKRKLLPSEK